VRKALCMAILLITPALVSSQTGNPSATQGTTGQTAQRRNHSTITGCLTSSKHDEYQIVDQQGNRNVVYSPTVHLDSYVGQSVTLIGDRDTSQGTDTGTGRPMAHFKVFEVQPASGNCK
jgi:hypothetical protein